MPPTIAVAVLTALVVSNLSGSGQEVTATHQPANKAVASGKALQEVAAGVATPIMSATLRTSKPTDLIMSVTLECAILTKLHNVGSDEPDATSAETASAQIDIWIQDEAGRRVPISSISSPPQNGSSDHLGDAVTCRLRSPHIHSDGHFDRRGSLHRRLHGGDLLRCLHRKPYVHHPDRKAR